MTQPLGTFSLVLHSHIPYVLAHGRSPHRLDSNEARQWLSGPTSAMMAPTVLFAGLAISVLYTSHKLNTSDREVGLLRMAYGAVGGSLLGMELSGSFMKPKIVQAPVTGDDPYTAPRDVVVTGMASPATGVPATEYGHVR